MGVEHSCGRAADGAGLTIAPVRPNAVAPGNLKKKKRRKKHATTLIIISDIIDTK